MRETHGRNSKTSAIGSPPRTPREYREHALPASRNSPDLHRRPVVNNRRFSMNPSFFRAHRFLREIAEGMTRPASLRRGRQASAMGAPISENRPLSAFWMRAIRSLAEYGCVNPPCEGPGTRADLRMVSNVFAEILAASMSTPLVQVAPGSACGRSRSCSGSYPRARWPRPIDRRVDRGGGVGGVSPCRRGPAIGRGVSGGVCGAGLHHRRAELGSRRSTFWHRGVRGRAVRGRA